MMVQCQSTSDEDLYFPASYDTRHVVVSGLPCKNEHHPTEIANMALDILQSVKDFVIPHLPQQKLAIRIGFHSGKAHVEVKKNNLK